MAATAKKEAKPATEKKPRPKKAKPVKPNTTLAADLDKYKKETMQLEAKARTLKAEWKELKEEAAEAKKLYEAALESVLKRIRGMDSPLPLFDANSQQPASSGTPSKTPAPDVGDDSWRKVTLVEVLNGLPPKKIALLEKADLNTLGELTDFQKAKGGFDWKIKGIGNDWRTKIEDRVVTWLEAWRHDQAKAKEAAADKPADADKPSEKADDKKPGNASEAAPSPFAKK